MKSVSPALKAPRHSKSPRSTIVNQACRVC
jgi:hypothetical protein